jgi:hypothetical protein
MIYRIVMNLIVFVFLFLFAPYGLTAGERQPINSVVPPSTSATITAPATLNVDPVQKIRIGSFTAEFEKTTLGEIRDVIGTGSIQHAGDAAESQYWLCYTQSGQRVWFISHGEMGGPDHQLTQVQATVISPPSQASTSCPEMPSILKSVSFDFGWLGTTQKSFLKALGTPSSRKNSRLIYHYAGKKSGKYHGQSVEWDVVSYVEATFTGNKVTSLKASHVTSY